MRAKPLADFLADPIDSYVQGRSYVVWVRSPTLLGARYFGTPDAADLQELTRLTDVCGHTSLASRYGAVADCGDLERMTLPAFHVLLACLTPRLPEFGARLRQSVVVRPSGMVGSTIAGVFHELIRPAVRTRMFDDRITAMRWMRDPDAEGVFAELQTLFDATRGPSAVVRRLREALQGRPGRPTIGALARVLGTSTRSLQRQLRSAGTSFRAEVDRARAEVAENALLETDLKLETIAAQVGCASLPHFSTLFRRLTGDTPSGFRVRSRSSNESLR